jgi:hypothetical protein
MADFDGVYETFKEALGDPALRKAFKSNGDVLRQATVMLSASLLGRRAVRKALMNAFDMDRKTAKFYTDGILSGIYLITSQAATAWRVGARFERAVRDAQLRRDESMR